MTTIVGIFNPPVPDKAGTGHLELTQKAWSKYLCTCAKERDASTFKMLETLKRRTADGKGKTR